MEKIELIFIIIEFVFLIIEIILNIAELVQGYNMNKKLEKLNKTIDNL